MLHLQRSGVRAQRAIPVLSSLRRYWRYVAMYMRNGEVYPGLGMELQRRAIARSMFVLEI